MLTAMLLFLRVVSVREVFYRPRTQLATLSTMTPLLFSHYLKAWLLPPGIQFLLLTAGFLSASVLRLKMIGRGLMITGVLSLWLLSLPVVAYRMVNQLQDQYPVLKPADLKQVPPHSLIVVLGGGETIHPEYGDKLTVSDATLHRINYGAYLREQTHLPILLSGGKTGTRSQANLMAEVLYQQFHVKADYLEEKSLTTADESHYIQPMLVQHHYTHVYLVTHAWHMPRSVYIFRRAGMQVIPAPMGHYRYGPGYSLISYFPNMDALYASSVAIHEYLGLLWYRWRYGSE